jgi:hypothetical protein
MYNRFLIHSKTGFFMGLKYHFKAFELSFFGIKTGFLIHTLSILELYLSHREGIGEYSSLKKDILGSRGPSFSHY